MITNEIIIALIGVLSTVIGTWTSWFLARKKYNVEVDSSLIENMQRSLDFYMRLSDDNKDRLEEEVQRLKEQVNDLIFQYQKSLRRQLKAKDEEISRIKHNKKN